MSNFILHLLILIVGEKIISALIWFLKWCEIQSLLPYAFSLILFTFSQLIYISTYQYIYIYIYYLAPFYFYSVSTADELQTPDKLFECVWPFWIHDTTKFSSMFLAILFSCYTYFPVNIRLQERHNYAKIASNVNITCFLKYNNVIDSFAKNLHHRRFTWSWIRFCFQ